MNKSEKLLVLLSEEQLGYMTKDELKDAVPELYKAYVSVYGNKKPDISINASEVFSFPVEKYSMGSWHTVFAYYKGKVKSIPVDKFFGKSEKLLEDSMFLDCIQGNNNFCELYVHPSMENKLLKGNGEELSDDEELVLAVMSRYKAFARIEYFYRAKYKNDSYGKEDSGEYQEVLKKLAGKGFVKINKAGSAMLTKEGKNMGVQVGKSIRKKYPLI